MQFTRVEPPKELLHLVECYWIVKSSESTHHLQKIIPDGFPEIIFHFGDRYRIKLTDEWKTQAESLLAGQITKYFFLENIGATDILGIKLKPTAITQLFGIDMSFIKDKVVDLPKINNEKLNIINQLLRSSESDQGRIDSSNKYLAELSATTNSDRIIEKAIDQIFSTQGTSSISTLCEICNISERQLERLFQKYIGLTPKFYSRVIRFSRIFQIAQNKKLSWSEVGLESGFYDQPHFIKNFKAFTGEDPAQYFFDEPNLANFFMKKV